MRAKVSAASSPAVTTSVARGSATKRAATKNGRAEEATPTVASCPESSFAQASSRAPDLASDADSISINMSVPFGKCPTPTSQGQKSGLPPYRQKRQTIRHSPTAPLAYSAKGPLGPIGARPCRKASQPQQARKQMLRAFSLVYSNIRMR